MSFYDVFSTFVLPEMSFYDVFLTLVIFLLRFGRIFEGFRKRAKIIGDYRWEVLTFAKSSGHFTRCFGGQVHQVLYLCSKEPRAISGTFPRRTGVFFISKLEPYRAGGMFTEKPRNCGDMLGKCYYCIPENLKLRFVWKLCVPNFSNL